MVVGAAVRILVTGDRRWTDRNRIAQILRMYLLAEAKGTVWMDVGDCSGADRLAAAVATEIGVLSVSVHAADWDRLGKAAGPMRNKRMLQALPDIVFAFHDDLAGSRGTRDVIEQARRRGLRVIHVTSTTITELETEGLFAPSR